MARNDYGRLSAGDVRALLALMGELYELSHRPDLLRDHLLVSLRRLTEARVALWVRLQESRRAEPWHVEETFDSGPLDHAHPGPGAGTAQCPRVILNGTDPMQVISRRRGRVVTATRSELIPDRDWYASRAVNETRRSCGVDDCIYSLHRLRPGAAAILLCVHRAWGDSRRFSARERLILHLLQGELGSIYHAVSNSTPVVPDPGRHLTPRMRQTLDLLLSGASEKQAAGKLDLSTNTVHVYVRALYKHFDVNTRAELLARFVNKHP